MRKAKRRLCLGYILTRRKLAAAGVAKQAMQAKAAPERQESVVGKSRTEFLTGLPVLKAPREAKPFKSEPLKMVPQTGDEFADADAPGQYSLGTSPVGEEELEDFEPGDNGEEPAGNSSGVSFEELSKTVRILDKEQPSDTEKQEAALVLYNIDGTGLFNFIAINDAYTEKARAMMAAFREQAGDGERKAFEMSEYME
ncbi:hypothetical protein IR083_01100 [Dysgonomonas sp. GY75]|uniref:hypothetical protein n=1 Tax=Dysgonomonas sp. GY75 TaxID=2780419 RepID=UPI00188398BC|nr:hypothetical protein [Dysgonomonas sp. GY75]MBF0647413.1 hypothetical protein [Dysgonomonas sp. GY75]